VRAFLLALVFVPAAFWPRAFAQGLQAPLDCGVVASGSFSSAFSDFYNLTAQPGDSILIRLLAGSTDPTFKPLVTLVDQQNHVVTARPAPAAPLPNTIALGATFAAEFDLNVGGSYRIQVQDNPVQAQGSYSLVYTWLNKPCGAGSLSCGIGVSGQIGQPLQLASYQFQASAGDILSARLARIGTPAAGFDVSVLVYSPAGQLLPNASGDIGSSGFRRLDVPAPTDGPVTIVLFDPANKTGNYAISVVKLKGQCGNSSLSCGSLSQGNIAGPLSENAYTVSLAAGDVVSLRYATTDPSSALVPTLEVYDPQGSLVQAATAGFSASRAIATTTFTAKATGAYVVIVADSGLVNTGNYAIYMLRLNRPCSTSPAPLGCASRVDGSVSGLFGTSQYTLAASANDQYLLRLLRTGQSGSFLPRVDIYDGQGSLFQTVSTGTLTSLTFSTPADGVYSVVVSDGFDGSQSGAYSFSLLRLNRPCNVAGTLACGAVVSGSFTRPLDSAVYTYNAAAGGSFSVRMLDNTGTLQPALLVYDPQGIPAGQTISASFTGVDVAQPAAGTYTVVAMDAATHPAGGPFGIGLVQTVNACAAAAAQGQTITETITAVQPFVSYSIPVSSGDALLVRSASANPGFTAQMDLYDPAGARLDSETFGISRKVATAGTYTVVVGASAARTGGGYSFSWQLLNRPSGAAPLVCGGSATASLTAGNQFRYYTAVANAGDLMRLIFTRLTDNFAPQIELFDPGGTRLAQTSDISQKAAAGGNYLVVVSPSTSAGETGSYNIAYQRPNSPCSPVALTCGQTTLRQVAFPGQLDAFTFAGTGGDQADIKLTPRTGAYFPFVELWDGSGNRLATGSSGVLLFTPQANATYALLVRDRGAVSTGSYRVSLADDTNACPVNDTEPPVVTLLQPTGGEVIPGGTLFHIQWQSDDNVGVATHDVALSADGGQTFATAIAAGLGGNQQSFDWTVPPDIAPSRKAVIRVTATDAAGNAASAASGLLSIIGSGFTPNSSGTYTYDAVNRVTSAALGDGRTIQYVWDAAGNLVQITVSGQ